MELTKYQKEFILEFFKSNKFPGWRNIAEILIKEATVLTTCQHTDIWSGGIGNFISSKESDEGVGVWRYNFNLSEFISSAMFKEHKEVKEKELKEKYLRFREEYQDIINL